MPSSTDFCVVTFGLGILNDQRSCCNLSHFFLDDFVSAADGNFNSQPSTPSLAKESLQTEDLRYFISFSASLAFTTTTTTSTAN